MRLLNKDKQLIFLATSFMYQFLEDKDNSKYKNEMKLLRSLGKLSSTIRDDLEEQLLYAYKYLEKITDSQDVFINPALLSVNCVFNLCETNRLDVKLSNKLFKDAMKIFKAIEKQTANSEDFKTTNKVISEFTKGLNE